MDAQSEDSWGDVATAAVSWDSTSTNLRGESKYWASNVMENTTELSPTKQRKVFLNDAHSRVRRESGGGGGGGGVSQQCPHYLQPCLGVCWLCLGPIEMHEARKESYAKEGVAWGLCISMRVCVCGVSTHLSLGVHTRKQHKSTQALTAVSVAMVWRHLSIILSLRAALNQARPRPTSVLMWLRDRRRVSSKRRVMVIDSLLTLQQH